MKSPLTLGSLTLGLFPLLNFLTPAQGDECQPGIILPVWMPQKNLSSLEVIGRGTVYFIAMIYMFIGVSIISERFMGAIERITSKQKEIKIRRPNGDTHTVTARVWNETVANLTLMALGSSAPEILLSIIEIVGKDFESGQLGPGTIVGSAAFNFFVIIAICILAIPNGEVRKIKHLRVFVVTCTWSIFAYVWLLVILKWISPGVVEIWEGGVTFFFFFATVLTAFLADKKLLQFNKLTKSYRLNKRGIIIEGEANTERGMQLENRNDGINGEETEEVKEFERHRDEYVEMLRDLRKKYPDVELHELEARAREEIFSKATKSRAFYRIQATRKLTLGRDLMKKLHHLVMQDAIHTVEAPLEEEKFINEHHTLISFNPTHYTVTESVGTFKVTVMRAGNLKDTVSVDYNTEDGTASSPEDYISSSGTLTFGPGEKTKEITIQVVDDEIFEEDEYFYIRLTNGRFSHEQEKNGTGPKIADQRLIEVVSPATATVTILDDDYGGLFYLKDTEIDTVESIPTLDIKVTRASGARGKVLVPYKSVSGTAKPGKDYQHVEGNLKFENNETEKCISIPILEENSYEKDVLFFLEISEPIPLDDNDVPLKKSEASMTTEEPDGWPQLGSANRSQIRIKESQAFKNTIDKLLQRDETSVVVGTSSWMEQFKEAISMDPGAQDDDEGVRKEPSSGDYIVHGLTVFWKVLFAFVPPTSILEGYLTFVVSIIVIGILTAFIGDIASHLGCTVGLKDSVTAIIFVALGTSVPDTFASKVAAVQDAYADASIGNVTGSNAVNVFLGIGIAWTMAAVVKAYRTCAPEMLDCNIFKVDPGSLGFSVSLFCACAIVGIVVLMLRRLRIFGGGELGGEGKYKYPTGIIFLSLWVFYVVISTMEAYELIEGF